MLEISVLDPYKIEGKLRRGKMSTDKKIQETILFVILINNFNYLLLDGVQEEG